MITRRPLAAQSALSLFVAALLFAPAAHAYPLYWIGTQLRGDSQAWQYSGFGSDGTPWSSAHAPAAEVSAAIHATFVAFAKGNVKDAAGQACSYLDFTETTPEGGAHERLSQEGTWTEGIFVSKRTDPIYQYMQGGVVAFALPDPDTEGYVADCDTVYNAADVPFSTDGSQLSLQGIGMQETAHCFGLHHVCQQSAGDGMPPCDGVDVDAHSVMFPFAQPGFGADQPDGRDQDNMCQIYPVNGIGRPCDPSGTGPKGEPVGFLTPTCAEGTTCTCTTVGQICTKTCAAAEDCPSGARCASGSCVPDFYPNTQKTGVPTRTAFQCDTGNQLHKPIGSACAADADCGQDEVCLTGIAGGYCSLACANANCPSDGVCVGDVLQAGDAWCLKACSFRSETCETSDCGDGQVCHQLGGPTAGVCFTGCTTDADCDSASPPQAVCDTATKMCHPKRTNPVCGPHRNDAIPPVCIPHCDDVLCGAPDGCGGTCAEGSGCTTPVVDPPKPPVKEKTGGCASFDVSALALGALLVRRRRLAQQVAGPLAVAALVVVASACSPAPPPQETPDAGTQDAGVTAANFRDEKAQAYCDYAKRCTPILEHYRCQPSTNAIGAELSAGRVGFDADQALQCVDGVRNSDCQADPFNGSQFAPATACDLATPPKLEDGASCFDDRDCLGGWCNTSDACPGACAKAAAVGESCHGVKCGKGTYCSPRSGKCVALADPGASCFFDQQCSTGFCHFNLTSGTGRCAAPKAATTGVRLGGACVEFNDCRPGLYCAIDPATIGTQLPNGTCQPQIDPGVNCGADGDSQGVAYACAGGLACVGFSVPERPSLHNPQLPGTCLPWRDVGEACVPVREGAGAAVTGCMYGLVCGADAKCALPVAGNACGVDQYSGCITGETCDGRQGKCVPYGGKGSDCFFDSQCVSGSCVGSRCTEPCKAN